MHSIIRAYDIRGVFGDSLTLEKITHLARQFAAFLPHHSKIVVGRDGRVHSPEISRHFIQTIREEGVDVIDLGPVPTPVLWFGIQHFQDVHAGIMITASHNPPQDNGFKMALKNKPLVGDDFLDMMTLLPQNRGRTGSYEEQSILSHYVKNINISPPQDRKIIWDTAHGIAGPVIRHLFPKAEILYEKVDGYFPAHEPDPTKEKNMKDLQKRVLEEKADMGIGIDGDGDRIGVIDQKGRLVPTELLMVLWSRDILQKHPGATIIGDVKSSRFFQESVEKNGGKFVMCRTGHSYIKNKMKETGALFGGEASGHIFFADTYGGFDDAIYASLRLLSLSPDLTFLENPYKIYDFQIECSDDKKFFVIDHMREQLEKQKRDFSDLDGVRVETDEGWWLVRASNTQALLTCRCEGYTLEALEKLKKEMESFVFSVLHSV